MTTVFAVALMTFAGCAGMKAKSDDELIKETVSKVKIALESKNVDMVLSTLGDDFEHPEVGGKAELKEMAKMGLDAGYADEGKCDISKIKITKQSDGTVEVYPLDLSSSAGSVTAGLIMKKYEVKDQNGKKTTAWLVKTVNVEGV
jgi:hypothetical protein